MELSTTAQPRKRRTWLWFFALLGTLAAVGSLLPRIIGPVHGLQTLTPETLKAAQDLWAKKGPRHYHLEYEKKGNVRGKVSVQVRDGKVISGTVDGQPLEPRLYPYHSMPAILDDLERFLQLSQKPGAPATVLKAQFNAQTGHLVRYVYVVSGTEQKVDLTVQLQPLNDDGTPVQPFVP
ncbi:MAG: hypothetical protein JNM56_39935 [Planctomycetia bacterium]|nr:hypothetical protein [Planctomycetia bacterium]